MSTSPSSGRNELSHLLAIIKKLRGRDGCPWDQKQTPKTIKKYLLEESNELAEAIDNGNAKHICEEIGDMFFILTMLTAMFEEKETFTIEDSLNSIIEKMIRRHPHVFGEVAILDENELRLQWESIKAKEKKEPGS
ncbi:MAG: nucleotide pyrophosphohydrolase [Desulfobulbaceae bacterium]|nr:nucleotide pyrophosphohydrolase [Desulfobulbaceae bacterium]